MKYFQLAFICFICVAKSYGQAGSRTYGGVEVEITKKKKPKTISTKVKITSPFPGGDSAWVKSIEDRLNDAIKLKRKAKAAKYIASVRFLIEKDGILEAITCFNDPGFGICEQVEDAIKSSTLGRWRPGVDSGHKVREFHTSVILFSPFSMKYKMDSIKKLVPSPFVDLLPPEFTTFSFRNEYYGESDPKSVPSFHRGHVFLLTLRQNCTFIYETFYKPYSYTRIEFLIGQYKISGDTVLLSYASLLPGKIDKIYPSSTPALSWQMPGKPIYLSLSKKGLSEPFEQRLNKTTSYTELEGGQFNLEMSKCWQ